GVEVERLPLRLAAWAGEVPQLLAEGMDRFEAPLPRDVHGAEDDRLERFRQVGAQRPRRVERAFGDRAQQANALVAGVGEPPGQRDVHQDAERVLVALGADRPLYLFGR